MLPLSPLFLDKRTAEINGSGCCMDDRHSVDTHTGVKTELLCNARYFVCRKHHAKTEKCMGLHGDQTEQQQRCLHECRKADRNNLLAPSCKAFAVASRKAEEIQTSDSNLRQENTASLDVCKETFDDAIAEADQHQECKKRIFRRRSRYTYNGKRLPTEHIEVDVHPDSVSDQVFCKGVLQIDRKAEELHGDDREEIYGKKSV